MQHAIGNAVGKPLIFNDQFIERIDLPRERAGERSCRIALDPSDRTSRTGGMAQHAPDLAPVRRGQGEREDVVPRGNPNGAARADESRRVSGKVTKGVAGRPRVRRRRLATVAQVVTHYVPVAGGEVLACAYRYVVPLGGLAVPPLLRPKDADSRLFAGALTDALTGGGTVLTLTSDGDGAITAAEFKSALAQGGDATLSYGNALALGAAYTLVSIGIAQVAQAARRTQVVSRRVFMLSPNLGKGPIENRRWLGPAYPLTRG